MTIAAWRDARGLSVERLAYLVDTDAETIRYWEYRGYDPTAERAFAIAWALRTPVDTIVFGPCQRGLELPNGQFLLAARGRDDLGWRARIFEWRGEGKVDVEFANRANAGWLESGPTAAEALDRVERGIRAALDSSAGQVKLALALRHHHVAAVVGGNGARSAIVGELRQRAGQIDGVGHAWGLL